MSRVKLLYDLNIIINNRKPTIIHLVYTQLIDVIYGDTIKELNEVINSLMKSGQYYK